MDYFDVPKNIRIAWTIFVTQKYHIGKICHPKISFLAKLFSLLPFPPNIFPILPAVYTTLCPKRFFRKHHVTCLSVLLS